MSPVPQPGPSDRAPDAIRCERVPKPGGGWRTLVSLDEVDRRAYDAVVGAVTPYVQRALAPGVIANRARAIDGIVHLEPWHLARRRYRRAIAVASRSGSDAAFVGDVRDCYGSITAETVEDALHRIGAPTEPAIAVGHVLRSFDARGVVGLPVGPSPSAVLANAVLTPVDIALARASEGTVLRWVDDVVVFAGDRPAARRAADAFDRALEEVGLVSHDGKSAVLDDARHAVPSASRSSPSPSASRADSRGMMRPP